MVFHKYFFVFICFYFFFSSLESKPIFLVSDQENYFLTPNVDVYEDPSGKIDIQQIFSSQSLYFNSNRESITNFGFTNSVFWIRIELMNYSTQQDWILEFTEPLMDSIEFYLFKEDALEKRIKSGRLVPFSKWDMPYKNPSFSITLEREKQTIIFLRLQTDGTMIFPMNLLTRHTFYKKTSQKDQFLSLYYGIMLTLIFYSLCLWFFLRESSYAFYILFITSFTLLQMILNGTAYQLLWPEFPWWNKQSNTFIDSILIVSLLGFLLYLLDIKLIFPKIAKITSWIMYVMIAFTGFTLFLDFKLIFQPILIIALLTTFFCLLIGIACLFKGNKPALYYVVSFFILLTGIITNILADFGTIPVSFFSKYGMLIGSILQAILLSIGLTNRVKKLQLEKETAQSLAIKNLKQVDQLKDQFLTNTSHELKNPLLGMISLTQFLIQELKNKIQNDYIEDLYKIQKSGIRLTHLINDILDFSKLKKNKLILQKTPIYLHKIVADILMLVEYQKEEKNLELINAIPKNIPFVLADENRIQQILYNLIGNSIKFTEEGEIKISTQIHHNFIEIIIEDTGVGINMKHIDTIFKPFEPVNEDILSNTKGTGIGLSLSKELLELHNSELELESEIGKGSTFKFTLPISEEQPQKVELEKQIDGYKKALVNNFKDEYSSVGLDENSLVVLEDELGNLEGARILIVDDEEVNIGAASKFLSVMGCNLSVTYNGKDALNLLKKQKHDLVLLDIMMPDMNGFDVLNIIRKEYGRSLPVIMLTEKLGEHTLSTSFKSGATDFMRKPFNPSELYAHIESHLSLYRYNKENKEMRHQLEEKNAQLVEADRLKDQFLANTSHELKTPLNGILSLTKAVIKKSGDSLPVRHKENLQMVYSSGKRLLKTINDILDFSQIQQGKLNIYLKEINVHEVLTKVLPVLEQQIESKTIKIINQIEPSSPNIEADPNRLEQIFYNLIGNAIKFTMKGNITLSCKTIEEMLHISVSDTGIGMHTSQLEHIFEPFRQGDGSINRKYSGTGLGLSIVKDIITLHKGEINVESSENKGTIFTFTIPIYQN